MLDIHKGYLNTLISKDYFVFGVKKDCSNNEKDDENRMAKYFFENPDSNKLMPWNIHY